MADDQDRGYYRPRVYGALLLFTVIAVLLVIDAITPEYAVDNLTVIILAGTGVTLLGLELPDWLRRD